MPFKKRKRKKEQEKIPDESKKPYLEFQSGKKIARNKYVYSLRTGSMNLYIVQYSQQKSTSRYTKGKVNNHPAFLYYIFSKHVSGNTLVCSRNEVKTHAICTNLAKKHEAQLLAKQTWSSKYLRITSRNQPT